MHVRVVPPQKPAATASVDILCEIARFRVGDIPVTCHELEAHQEPPQAESGGKASEGGGCHAERDFGAGGSLIVHSE